MEIIIFIIELIIIPVPDSSLYIELYPFILDIIVLFKCIFPEFCMAFPLYVDLVLFIKEFHR